MSRRAKKQLRINFPEGLFSISEEREAADSYKNVKIFVKKRVCQFKEIARYDSLVHRRKTNFDRPSFWNSVVVVVKTPIHHLGNLS